MPTLHKSRRNRQNLKLAVKQSHPIAILPMSLGTSSTLLPHDDAWVVAHACGVEVCDAQLTGETAYNLGVPRNYEVYCIPAGPLGKQLAAMGARRD
jgi:hypothetical protein